jgi:hypothetical protein
MFVFWRITTGWDNSNGILFQKSLSKDEIASRGDGETRGEWIDVSDFTEQVTQFEATATQNVDIGLAIA